MARVADLLGVTLDSLVGRHIEPGGRSRSTDGAAPLAEHLVQSLIQQEGGERLSSDMLLRLHTRSGGRIEAFESWQPRCDQYYVPMAEDTGIRVKCVGYKSLSAITMGVADQGILQGALDAVPDDILKARWLSDYKVAHDRGMLTTVESLNVQMPNHPVRVKMDFIRCLLSVRDADSQEVILNFSILVV